MSQRRGFRSVFSLIHNRLSNIIRYNNTPTIHKESVAEHSYFVALYSMMLADRLKSIDKVKIMQMALIHDVEEIISGDFPYKLKVDNKEFSDALEKINLISISSIFKDYEEYIVLWKELKEQITIESKVVKIADEISALIYATSEVNLGNSFMVPMCIEMKSNLAAISDDKMFEFITEEFDANSYI